MNDKEREALQEQAMQDLTDFHQSIEQPVAYVYEKNLDVFGVRKDVAFLKSVEVGTYLYTTPQPVRTKDLTDDEIDEIGKSYFDEWSFGFARAVIAADREKNK